MRRLSVEVQAGAEHGGSAAQVGSDRSPLSRRSEIGTKPSEEGLPFSRRAKRKNLACSAEAPTRFVLDPADKVQHTLEQEQN